MTFKFSTDGWGSSFSVPAAVVNKYLKNAKGEFVKVLLCILSGERIADSAEIAQLCGVDEQTVLSAVEYWESFNVIIAENPENAKSSFSPVVSAQKVMPVSVVEAVNPDTDHNPPVNRKITVTYSPKEIREKVDNDENLKQLFNEIQKLQFSINNKELEKLLELYELYHFDVPSILLAADYCNMLGKRSIAYLSKVMTSWYDEGIESYKDIERKIIEQTNVHKYENEILHIFGMENKPSPKQRQYIEKWNQMGINKELVEIAYNKCMDKKSKLNFSYIDGIIKNWTENNITNAEQVAISDAKYQNDKNDSKRKFTKPENSKEISYSVKESEDYFSDFRLYDDDDDGNEGGK